MKNFLNDAGELFNAMWKLTRDLLWHKYDFKIESEIICKFANIFCRVLFHCTGS